MADLSKRANLLGVREVRGLVLADPMSPTGSLGADWSSLVRLSADESDPEFWTFTGAASIVDSPYTVRDMFGEFQETIRAGAFDKTLSENPDVMFNYMHDPSTTMATTRGGGLKLSVTPHLGVEARIPRDDVDAQRVMPKVARGDATSMSFAFRVTQQTWDEDYTDRQITEVNLHRGDVASIVSGLGANPPAWGTVRSMHLGPRLSLPAQRSLPADMTYGDLYEALRDELKESYGQGTDVYLWVRDFNDEWVVYHLESDTESEDYQIDYLVDAEGQVSFSGDPIAVQPKTIFIPEPPEQNSVPDFLKELVAVQLRSRDSLTAR